MSLYFEIISDRKKGVLPAVARAALFTLSVPYARLLASRNWYYDYLANATWLDRPCISIGNLTTGGTGKTPLVIWLANELLAAGKRVAIISRGYKGDAYRNDEFELVSVACPKAICIAHPNRVAAGQYAVQEQDVDVVLLDDGFQHRRLGRDLDIVLIDASCPLGHGHVLPRGMLRESAGGLRRADVVILTRISCLSPGQLAELKTQVADLSPEASVFGCDHRPTALHNESGDAEETSQLSAQRAVALAGIGNPGGFVHTLTQLGIKPIHTIAYPDHHRYSLSDCHKIAETALQVGAETLLTTEKDMTKLRRLEFDWPVPLRSLAIKIDFAGQGGKMLMALVHKLFEEELGSNVQTEIRAD